MAKRFFVILGVVADVIAIVTFAAKFGPVRTALTQLSTALLIGSWSVGLFASFVALYLSRSNRIPGPTETVTGKVFGEGKTVKLDGRRFVACTFRNCVVAYSERATFDLGDSKFEGKVRVSLHGKHGDLIVRLLTKTDSLNKNWIEVGEGD